MASHLTPDEAADLLVLTNSAQIAGAHVERVAHLREKLRYIARAPQPQPVQGRSGEGDAR